MDNVIIKFTSLLRYVSYIQEEKDLHFILQLGLNSKNFLQSLGLNKFFERHFLEAAWFSLEVQSLNLKNFFGRHFWRRRDFSWRRRDFSWRYVRVLCWNKSFELFCSKIFLHILDLKNFFGRHFLEAVWFFLEICTCFGLDYVFFRKKNFKLNLLWYCL